jgi:hypothetical protein
MFPNILMILHFNLASTFLALIEPISLLQLIALFFLLGLSCVHIFFNLPWLRGYTNETSSSAKSQRRRFDWETKQAKWLLESVSEGYVRHNDCLLY